MAERQGAVMQHLHDLVRSREAIHGVGRVQIPGPSSLYRPRESHRIPSGVEVLG